MALNFESLLDLFYPPRCRFCKEVIVGPDNLCFCHVCRQRIRQVAHPFCQACGYPFQSSSGADHLCGTCLKHPPEFVRARAWACYPPGDETMNPFRSVLQQFKYGRKVSLGKPLGRLLAEGCGAFVREFQPDVIVPVPLHPQRLRWRGFNQAVILGKPVSREQGVPMDPFILYRSVVTEPQTQLSEPERKKNVRGAFTLNPKKPLEGRKVLLIDDIYTSGATANECSRTLIRGGAGEVAILTLARTIW